MVLFVIVGILLIFVNLEILFVIIISGIMVLGLVLVFLLWKMKVGLILFYFVVGVGIVLGILFVFGVIFECLIWFFGKYGDLFSVNFLGIGFCFLFFLLLIWGRKM